MNVKKAFEAFDKLVVFVGGFFFLGSVALEFLLYQHGSSPGGYVLTALVGLLGLGLPTLIKSV